MKMIVRDAQEADHDAMAAMFYQIQKEEFFWTNQEQLSLADFDHSTEGERIIVAEIDGIVAGFISVWEADKFIHNLFVARECRHMGVGKALFQKTLDEYGTPLTLKCIVENETALKFYAKNGWQIEHKASGEEGAYYLLSFGKKTMERDREAADCMQGEA